MVEDIGLPMSTPGTCFLALMCPLLLAAAPLRSFAQTSPRGSIQGTIRDAATGQPVENVNVFLASTSYGTGSNKDGTFLLTLIPTGHYQIVFSRVGYTTEAYAMEMEAAGSREFNVKLTARVIQLGEVEVSEVPYDESQRQYRNLLGMFLREFLGSRPAAKFCTLTNPLDLRLSLEGENIIHARAVGPIQVDNRALGYTLRVELQDFVWWRTPNIGTILVFPQFISMKPHDRGEEKLWRANRRASYFGSLTHFLRALYRGKTYAEGFRIQKGTTDELLRGKAPGMDPEDFAVTDESGTRYKALRFVGWVRISFDGEFSRTTSLISVKGDAAYFDAAGSLRDPTSLYVGGDWAGYRMSDMLPLNIDPAELLEEPEDPG